MSAQLDKINAQISALEVSLSELKAQRKAIIDSEAELQAQKTACDNALSSLFDGLKYVADAENPFPIVGYPMRVYPNMFYSTSANDGVKNIVHKYVCIATQPTDLTEDNFSEILTEWFD